MARQGYPVLEHMGGVKVLTGQITLGATSISSENLTTRGIASSVVRNSAGDYTITLADSFAALEDFKVAVLADTAADLQSQLTAVSVPNKTVQFRILTGDTATDGTSGVILYVRLEVRELV